MTSVKKKTKISNKTKPRSNGKHPGGRPSKKASIDFEQMKRLYLAGWDDAKVAGFFNISQRTIDNWKKSDPEFFQSLKDWKAQADGRVERSLYDRATGYSHMEEVLYQYQGKIIRAQTIKQYPGDVTAQIFWLKNRQPEKWRDKMEHEHKGDLYINYGHRKQK